MKIIKILLSLSFCLVLAFACSKKPDSPEPYSAYLTMQISNIVPLSSETGNSIQIYIKNNSGKEFEKECLITYTLKDSVSGSSYTSENLLVNKIVPNLPNGVFSLKYYDAQFITINLKNLIWGSVNYESIIPNQYLLTAQLFIKDPYSPMNIIKSNQIIINKE